MCMDCYIDFEASLKQKGLFKEQTIMMKKGNLKYYIKGMESVLVDVRDVDNFDSYVTEQGDVESWKGNISGKKAEVTEKFKEYITYLKSKLD